MNLKLAKENKMRVLTFFFHFAHFLEVASSATKIVARIRPGRGRIALLACHLFIAELTKVQRFVQVDQLFLAQAFAHLSL